MKNDDVNNLGEKKNRIKISLGYVMPLLYPVVGLFMMGLLVVPVSNLNNWQIYSVILTAAGVLLIAYIFIQIFHSGIELYENGFVIVSAFGKKVYMRDNIKVIHWDKPGQYAGTTRQVVRKTNGFAEVMLVDGKMVKIPDSAYKDLPTLLGEWQAEQEIPFDF